MNLQETPTLNVSSHANPAELHDAMTAKLQQAIEEADASPSVAEAAAANEKAETHLARMGQAHRTLNALATKLRAFKQTTEDAYVDCAIQAASDGREPESGKLAEIGRIENQNRLNLRALQRVAEILTPQATTAERRARARWLQVRASAIEAIAQARAERPDSSYGGGREFAGHHVAQGRPHALELLAMSSTALPNGSWM